MIDLHCHSSCSDGTDPPEALAGLAASAGLHAVALTDHDTVEGYERFAEACAAVGVQAVPGAEISCLEGGHSAHVLCYFVPEDPGCRLRGLLDRLRDDRETRNDQLVARLAELGYERVTAEEIRREAAGDARSIGRPHVASAIERLYPGRFPSRQAIFDDLLGEGGPAYIQKAWVSIAEATAAARADGAVTVLAHPLRTLAWALGRDRTLDALHARLAPIVERLAADGLCGLECYYPSHDAGEVELLLALAAAHDLVPTGGSDYHGANKPGLSLGSGTGSLRVPDAALEALEARRDAANRP